MSDERKRSGWLWWATVAFGAASLWALWFSYGRNQMLVENKSGRVIELFQVTVGGRTTEILNLLDGASQTAAFRIVGDDSFLVEGHFADGEQIVGGSFGYVTHGMHGERARFTVLPTGEIDFHQWAARLPPATQSSGCTPIEESLTAAARWEEILLKVVF